MAPRGRRRGSPRASAEDDDESGDSETDETESDVSGSEDEGDGGDGREGNARPSHKKKATTTGGKDVRDTESDNSDNSMFSETDETEEDEDVFDETNTVDDVLRSVDAAAGPGGSGGSSHTGPAPYEILARRKREANEKNKAAFLAELKSRGVRDKDVRQWHGQMDGRNPGKSQNTKLTSASQLLLRHQIDKADLLRSNPAFAVFLGAANKSSELDKKKAGVGRGRSKKPRKTARRVVLDEAALKLGEANTLYANGSAFWPRAVELLLEVIRLTPNDPDPYHTMSMIHDETREEFSANGDTEEAERYAKKALDYSMIGALLKPRDTDTWYHLAQKARSGKNPRAALFCLAEALKNDSKPYSKHGKGVNNRWQQAQLYLDIREPRKALEHLLVVLDKSPGNAQAATRLAQVRADLGDADGAERTLRDFVAEYPLNVDLNLINVFCERKMEHHQFGEVVSLIETTRGAVITSELERLKRERLERADETRIAAISSALDDTSVDQARAYLAGAYAAKRSVEESLARQKNGTTFPPELTTKLAMCLLYLNKRVEARQRLDELKKTNPSAFFDLWFDAGVACQSVSEFDFAEVFFTTLMHAPGLVGEMYDVPEVWERVACCVAGRVKRSTNDVEYATTASAAAKLEFYRSVAARHPKEVHATLPLAELLFARGSDTADVLSALPNTKDLLEQLVDADRPGFDEGIDGTIDDTGEELETGNLARKNLAKKRAALRERLARALSLRRRLGGDDDFIANALGVMKQLREDASDGNKTSKKKHKKTQMENPNPNGGGKRPRLVSQSHGVFVGYQKRNRSKPKKDDADDDDDEDPPDDDADEDEDGVVVPKTQKQSLKAHTKTRNPVPFELSLHLAHAYFLRRDLKSALKLLDEVLKLPLRVSNRLGRGQLGGFLYLKAQVQFAAKDFKAASETAKLLCEKVPHSTEAWFLNCQSVLRSGHGRDAAVFFRSVVRVQPEQKREETREDTERGTATLKAHTAAKTCVPALLSAGAAQCEKGNWALGLDEFEKAFRVAADEPVVSLLCGIAGARVATNGDFSADPEKRHATVLKAVAFLQKAGTLRGLASRSDASHGDASNGDAIKQASANAAQQEASFNLARGLHQLGLLNLAARVYETCLGFSGGNVGNPSLDLRFEAAHNLALIYRASGADALARRVLREHAVM